MTDDTILYRHVPTAWIATDGGPSLQAFSPTSDEGYKLSLVNGDVTTAEQAQTDHIAEGHQSDGVAQLTVRHFDELGLEPIHDQVPTFPHVSVQYPPNDRPRRRAIAMTLAKQARWAIRPTSPP